MGSTYGDAWAGGRTRQTKDGVVFVLRQRRNGVGYQFTLNVTSEKDAMGELALFNRDPEGYAALHRRGQVVAEPVVLDLAKLEKFLDHMKLKKNNTELYRANIRNRLAWWMDALKGADLRHVQLKDLNEALDTRSTDHRGCIIAIKSFGSWLRGRGDLAIANDPTLGLKVPQGKAARLDRVKLVNLKELERIYSHIDDQVIRDIVKVRINTGMHHSEVVRVAKGEVAIHELADQGEIAGTITFTHKSGRQHLISMTADWLAAVKRLVAVGGLPSNKTIDERLGEAAAAAGVKKCPEQGAFRHSFITQAVTSSRTVAPNSSGATLEDITAVTGNSVEVAKEFYLQVKVKRMVVLPLKLHHPKDPVPLQRQLTSQG